MREDFGRETQSRIYREGASGMDGIVVSNHTGRQIDGAVGALKALPAIVEAVGGRIPILFDSGVRCGADVLTALALSGNIAASALGADSVMLKAHRHVGTGKPTTE